MTERVRLSKKLGEMTKEEAVAELIRLRDPEIVGNHSSCMAVHLDSEGVEPIAFMLRGDKYYSAPISFDVFGVDGVLLNWKESTREAFLSETQSYLESKTLPDLLCRLTTDQLMVSLIRERDEAQAQFTELFQKVCELIDGDKEKEEE